MAKNDGGVNYIRHLLSISEKFIDDERLSPLHISLYYAVFQSWNLSMFRNPISVSRNELMRASKIGSANTYTKCLKELDEWGYIKYNPSFNPHKGSQIYLYTFNKTTDNGTDIPTDKSSDKTTKKASDKGTVKALIPSINSTNTKNKTNKLNLKNENGPTSKKSNRKIISSTGGTTTPRTKKAKKIPRPENSPPFFKGEYSEGGRGSNEIPSLQEINTHFIIQKWPLLEAQKFFNHYESNGWLVAGKTPMKNWKASASKWMLNVEQFHHPSPLGEGTMMRVSGVRSIKPNKLNASTNKDYSEPL